MLYSSELKTQLFAIIDEMEAKKEDFVYNPGKDFSRKRKQSFQDVIKFLLSMENDATKRELLKFFNFSSKAPTDSAFNQQRAKIKTSAFEYLFHQFTSLIEDEKYYNGYRLLACDGSGLYISRNPNDSETYFASFRTQKGFNLLHLNTIYDLNNRKYLDAEIQTIHQRDERNALRIMLNRLHSEEPEKTILIADRGYTGLNIFDFIDKKHMKYLIRTKSPISNKMLYGIEVPNLDEFDTTVTLCLTHSEKQAKQNMDKSFHYIPRRPRTKLLEIEDVYVMKLRIVKFPLKDNSYEYLVTNLSQEEFNLKQLKELYGMRWGIESAYKELKYAAGLINFHVKKREYIIQEIWARLTLFNYSEAVAMRITMERLQNKKSNKYKYQLNYTTTLYLCRLYLKIIPLITAIQLETIIESNILPIRQGRTAFRPKRPHQPVSFCYRLS